jgi:hypothetical protein
MWKMDATLHRWNKGSNSFSSKIKVENRTNATNGGRGRNSLRPFNGKWTPTTDTSTYWRSSFIYRPGTLARATIIWTNQGIHTPVGAKILGGREICRDCKEGTICCAHI